MFQMVKKQNLKNQMKQELHRQFHDAQGESRHSAKRTMGYTHHSKIYSRNSLNTHLRQTEQFANWMKQTHPGVKSINEISRSMCGEYLTYRQNEMDCKAHTISADMLAINHILCGSGTWDKQNSLSKSEFNLKSRLSSNITNNRNVSEKAHRVLFNAHKPIVEVGQAFGLRRSELVPTRENRGYAITQNSMYKVDGKLYCCVVGKGGRYRAVECLKSHQGVVESKYSSCIQRVDRLPSASEFKQIHANSNYLFNSVSRSLPIHVVCRQYYANHKLAEIQSEGREYHVLPQNQTKSGKATYTTNGVTMEREHAQFVSDMLGHNRISELKSYINLN